MAYSDKVLDHYENPRNVGAFDKGDDTIGTGMVGAPACGDVMKLQIKVGADGLIEDAKFKTYGCGSAIASSSLVTEWVKGKTLDQALANASSGQFASAADFKTQFAAAGAAFIGAFDLNNADTGAIGGLDVD
ncbi:MAG: iron-sulfur cluster assembly scaffold protein, partial [Janthinobacterium sp.]